MKKYNSQDLTDKFPKLHFKADAYYSDFETESKGYRNDVLVELPNGDIIEVFFYDLIRLSQDMGNGEYLSKPGLIILNKVNKKSIHNSVNDLYGKGFFDYFKSRSSFEINHFDENI